MPKSIAPSTWRSLFVSTYLSALVCCVQLDIEYTLFYINEEYKDVAETELTSRVLGEAVKYLEVKKYKKEEDQVELIGNLPHLEKFYMIRTGQQITPTFENLPRLKEIYLDKNELIYLKRGSISETPAEVVHLNYNDVRVIESGAFGHKVEILRLSCNKIRKFSARWFKNATGLIELHVNANLLTAIEKEQFKQFSSLSYIDFSMNKIATVGEGAFRNRRSFGSLLLQHNRLLEFTSNIFLPGNVTIENLSINNNRLTYISREFLDRVLIKNRLQVDDNPWQCKCWDNINKYVAKNVLIFTSFGNRCVSSTSFDEHCVPFIATELIECYDKQLKIPPFNKDVYCNSFKNSL